MTLPLFSISTDQFELNWAARGLAPTDREAAWHPPGQLAVRRLNRSQDFPTVVRNVPEATSFDEDAAATADLGPRLREETEYSIYLRPRDATVRLEHDDPVIRKQLSTEKDGAIHGGVNFRSNVGLSEFRIVVDGRPAYAFIVQVFPTKLDYETDYKLLIADVQDIATGLALEYLRSTYQLGRTAADEVRDDLQWVLLLRHVFDDLEHGVRHIANQPRRSIVREEVLQPVHKVRRPDSSVRRSIRHRKGSGPLLDLGEGISARANVRSQPARQTLDTPEHRWLAHQIRVIQQGLSRVIRTLDVDEEEDSTRRRAQVKHLRDLESATTRLGRFEPLAAASVPPPPGFASQQLTSAPGYREAYQACLILRAGLHLEGDALRLSTKEVHQLYEYWCYLLVVRIVARFLETPPESRPLFQIHSSGLRLDLRHGQASEITFREIDYRIRIRYNPSFPTNKLVLVPQRPDILLTVEHEGWPSLHLVIDAKYRVDDSSTYVNRYGGIGPPEDALNVLHRYRDAILEQFEEAPARHVVNAAAMFPGSDVNANRDEGTRHWASLQKIGVGALPALPGATEYVEKWLQRSLVRSGWELSEQSIPHAAHERMDELRELERQRVWTVAVDEVAVARVRQESVYIVDLQGHEEAVRADHIGFLLDRGDSADLTLMRIQSRSADGPPGPPERSHRLTLRLAGEPETQRLERDTTAAQAEGVTSLLAIRRATALSELALDRLEDWRLRDALSARDMFSAIEATKYDALPSRPWLRTAAEGRVRYEGRDGYAWEKPSGTRSRSTTVQELFADEPSDHE